MPKKKEETLQDILDRIEDDLQTVRDKAIDDMDDDWEDEDEDEEEDETRKTISINRYPQKVRLRPHFQVVSF
jgi:hypothetical protein